MSRPEKVSHIDTKVSFISEGDMKTFDLSEFVGLDDRWFRGITDFSDIILGITATRFNGKAFEGESVSQTLDSLVNTHHILYDSGDYFSLQGDNTTDTGATDTLTVLDGIVTLGDQNLSLPEGHAFTKGIGDVFYVGAKNGATVNFGNDQIIGSKSDDYIYGDLDADYSSDAYPGGGTYNFGNDELYGNQGNDTIYGDARILGNFPSLSEDQGTFNTGSDHIIGGDGNDYLMGDIEDGNSGRFTFAGDEILGGNGNDTLVGDVTYLLAFSDSITATCGNDKLSGNKGNDEIYGDAGYVVSYSGEVSIAFGDDELLGGEGDDHLYGDALNVEGSTVVTRQGNDILVGGKGADILTGGSGKDIFVFTTGDSGQTATTLDTITDYTKGAVGTGDLIDFSSKLTIGGSAAIAKSSEASINMSTGIATFATGSGTTLSDAVLDVAKRMAAAENTSGEFALFQVNHAGDYYAFISDGISGLGANDVLIQLIGIHSITSINLTGDNLTIIG